MKCHLCEADTTLESLKCVCDNPNCDTSSIKVCRHCNILTRVFQETCGGDSYKQFMMLETYFKILKEFNQ